MLQQLKNMYHLLQACFANIWYGFPARKLTVIGITGTSGKTTTTMMLYHVLKQNGYKVAMISTVKAVIGGKEYDTGFHVTTPSPLEMPKYIQKAVNGGDKYLILEVSSHAIDQNRIAFIPFTLGMLTSLSHEHLDYHKTMTNYARTKFKLLKRAQRAIVPVTVLTLDLLKAVRFNVLHEKVVTFGIESGDITQKEKQLELQVPGEFNTLNALGVYAACMQLGVPEKQIHSALASFSGLPGRCEKVPNTKGMKLIIDFAHKPDAIHAILEVAQTMVTEGKKIIIMYGSASERDTLKRPLMGKISGLVADITVLTDEDPRFEDPMKILDEVGKGCEESGAILVKEKKPNPFLTKQHVYYKIPDRQQAIDFIINTLAEKGDVVLFCGKGHEKSMNYKGIEKPWSEHEAIKKALKKGDFQ